MILTFSVITTARLSSTLTQAAGDSKHARPTLRCYSSLGSSLFMLIDTEKMRGLVSSLVHLQLEPFGVGSTVQRIVYAVPLRFSPAERMISSSSKGA